MKLYMFRTVPLPIIRSLFTVHSAMVYVIQVCRQLSSRTGMDLHPGPARNKFVKLVHLVDFITKKFVTMNSHMKVKFHYCVCKNMPRSQILNQNNPYYPFPFYFFKTQFSITLLSSWFYDKEVCYDAQSLESKIPLLCLQEHATFPNPEPE